MTVEALARTVVDGLGRQKASLAVAESLTGGLVGAALTDIPGASAVYRGGITAYATDLKTALLGVPAQLLSQHGPVHSEVALAMARGVRARVDATYGLAITGVAGPDAQGGCPPGLVYVAICGTHTAHVARLDFEGGRAQVRSRAVLAALRLVADELAGSSGDAEQMIT